MLTSIKLFVVLTVVTCVIAYWSDNLGKKLGKKRISLFGLRPRQTATAIGMASSLAITMVTFIIVSGIDSSVRHALLRFDEINLQSEESAQRVRLLNSEIPRLVAQTNDLKRQKAQVIRVTTAQVHSVRQELSSLKGEVKTQHAELSAAKQGELEARQSAASAQQSAAQAHQRVLEAQAQLNTKQQQLGQKQQQLDEVQGRLSGAKLQLATTQSALSRAHHNVVLAEGVTRGVMRELGILTQTEADLQQKVKVQQAKVSDLEDQRKTLDATVQQLREDVNLWHHTAGELDRTVGQLAPLANGNIIVSVNQVFAVRTLPADVTSSQALAILRQIVADANAIIKKPPVGGQVLHLTPLQVESGGQRVELGEDEILNRLADYITTFDVPASVRLVAAFNQVEGETQIWGRMIVVPVRAVFTDGDLLAASTIDGTQTDARIFNQLLTLVNEAERTTRAKGVMPPMAPDNPNFYASGTNERIFEALRHIQSIKGPAKVRLLAAEEVNTADPVHVRFDVSRFEVSRP